MMRPADQRSSKKAAVLQDAHVLLLEDEALINLATADILQELGCRVSTFMRVEHARAAINQETPDVAVLDVNIAGEMSYAVAEKLHAAGVPIVFLTGYSSPALTGKWKSFPRCHKPFETAKLKELLVNAMVTRNKRT